MLPGALHFDQNMKQFSIILTLVISGLFVACQGTKADQAITVGEEQDSMVWAKQSKNGPIVVSEVDTSDMYVLTDKRGVYLVKERYNTKGETNEEVWVVKKIVAQDSASAI